MSCVRPAVLIGLVQRLACACTGAWKAWTTSPEVLTFRVNEHRLLGEVGLLFGSATVAFAECVQNSYRARATTLRVIADPTARTVIFRDNGEGLTDPEKLLTIAESGWDETRVKHAAGMGGFALWALATEVEVRSMPAHGGRPWRIRFTEDALQGRAPVLKEAITRALWAEYGNEPHGVEIRATLKDTATFPALDAEGSEAWRHRFPITVTIETPDTTSADGVMRTLYTITPHNGYTIVTSVGNVHVTKHSPIYRHQIGPVGRSLAVEWEHRYAGLVNFKTEVLTPDVCDNLPKSVISELLLCLENVQLVWVVAPSAHVEAKLPDRETLIRDEGFREAMQVIARALLAEFDVADLRDTYVELAEHAPIVSLSALSKKAKVSTDRIRPRFDKLSLSSFSPEPFLQLAGYQLVNQCLLSAASCSLERDLEGSKLEVEYEDRSAMVKPMYTTPFALVAVEAGVPAIDHTAGQPVADLIPLRIAAAEMLAVPSLRVVFARDLRLVAPDGTTVVPLRCGIWGGPYDCVTDLEEDLALALPPMPEGVRAIFPLPSETGQSLADSIIAYMQQSDDFLVCMTILAEEFAWSEFPLNLWDYVISETGLDSQRLTADAQRVVAEALGDEYVVVAERAAVLADLSDALSVSIVTGNRLEQLVERARAATVDATQLSAMLAAQQVLREGLAFVGNAQKTSRSRMAPIS